MAQDFARHISKKLDLVANKVATDMSKKILNMAEYKAESPEAWPLAFEDDNMLSNLRCPRIAEFLTRILDGYGLLVDATSSFVVVDLLLDTYDEECDIEVSNGEERRDIPKVEEALEITKQSLLDKRSELYDMISSKIYSAASEGKNEIKIEALKEGFDNIGSLKKLFKHLSIKGYGLCKQSSLIRDGSKRDLKGITTFTIMW